MKLTKKEIDKISKVTDKDTEKMDYKEKQNYFRKRSKLCKKFYDSGKRYDEDKNPIKGTPYRKTPEVK